MWLVTITGAECNFPLIPWLNANAMIDFSNVKFGIDFGLSNSIQ